MTIFKYNIKIFFYLCRVVQQARAVWRNGGSNPAETAVQIWKFVSRRKFSGSRHCAKPLGRCTQVGDSTASIRKRKYLKLKLLTYKIKKNEFKRIFKHHTRCKKE